jgi:glutamate/tyrosine decarboxylase-like PLP-dependent enzyme
MNNIQKTMFKEIKNKTIFEQAWSYAFEYANQALTRNVFPSPEAIENLEKFDESLSILPENPENILEQLHKYGSPATVASTGGRYFGFVTGGVLPTVIPVKWLLDVWDQNPALYLCSPIVSKIENLTEKWLVNLLGLPTETAVGFVGGSSAALLCGLAAARNEILKNLNWNVNSKGLIGAPGLRVILGEKAHATVFKALAILGIGHEQIERAPVDAEGRIIPGQMPELDSQTIVILQAGNVNSGSFDPFEIICDRANKVGAWVHIDGAFGLWAAASKKKRFLINGFEKADSWAVDAHKTLNAPYDNGIILCKNREALTAAMSLSGSYIQFSDQRDGMLYTPDMSRRARAIELWATLKSLGKSGVEQLVNELCDRARQFADQLYAEGYQILNEVDFNQVLVSCENDELTDKTLKFIQKSGECWCGGARWGDRKVIRISVCSWATTSKDISRSVKAFIKAKKFVKV